MGFYHFWGVEKWKPEWIQLLTSHSDTCITCTSGKEENQTILTQNFSKIIVQRCALHSTRAVNHYIILCVLKHIWRYFNIYWLIKMCHSNDKPLQYCNAETDYLKKTSLLRKYTYFTWDIFILIPPTHFSHSTQLILLFIFLFWGRFSSKLPRLDSNMWSFGLRLPSCWNYWNKVHKVA